MRRAWTLLRFGVSRRASAGATRNAKNLEGHGKPAQLMFLLNARARPHRQQKPTSAMHLCRSIYPLNRSCVDTHKSRAPSDFEARSGYQAPICPRRVNSTYTALVSLPSSMKFPQHSRLIHNRVLEIATTASRFVDALDVEVAEMVHRNRYFGTFQPATWKPPHPPFFQHHKAESPMFPS